MLHLTWTELVARLDEFEEEDYKLWFQEYLMVLIPSFTPEQLQRIPTNISCESYEAM